MDSHCSLRPFKLAIWTPMLLMNTKKNPRSYTKKTPFVLKKPPLQNAQKNHPGYTKKTPQGVFLYYWGF